MRLGLLLALLLGITVAVVAGCEDDDYGKDAATNRDMSVTG